MRQIIHFLAAVAASASLLGSAQAAEPAPTNATVSAGLAPADPGTTAVPNTDGKAALNKGWFYFETKPKPPVEPPKKAAAEPPPAAPAPPPKSKEELCSAKGTWTADCGFINPGEDFEFQAKQRDALMERMVVSNNNPKAVEDFQYYMRWVLERTSQVTNLWWYNMVQNPELDPTAAQPVSAMGLRLMTEVQTGAEREVFDLVKDEGGMFVFFSRSDCAFCHQMGEPLRALANRTKLPVRNAPLDGVCIEGFQEGCEASDMSFQAAQALQVGTVPAVFLYVKPNTWLRVATGISDTESMATRAMQFFSAYRSALIKGIDNGSQTKPSVDFSGPAPTGMKSTGIAKPTTPQQTENVISDMLGRHP